MTRFVSRGVSGTVLALLIVLPAAPGGAQAGEFLDQGGQIYYVPDDMKFSGGMYTENAPTHPPGSSEPYGWSAKVPQFNNPQALAAKARRLGVEEEDDICGALNISHATFVSLVKSRQLDTVLALARQGRMSEVADLLAKVAPRAAEARTAAALSAPQAQAAPGSAASEPALQATAVPDAAAIEAALAEQAAQQEFYGSNLVSQHARAAVVGDTQ